ncbi:MAG: PQQ-dependent sugar dehydrogenase [Gemmatales bacterium]
MTVRSVVQALTLASVLLLSSHAAEPPDARKQVVSAGEASRDATLSTARIKLEEGFKAELYAAEPLLANPVAFCFDNTGSIYVVETYRIHAGVTDNRSHMYWLDDDLACNTVADRDAKYRKHLKDQYKTYEKEDDRVRKLIDSTGKGGKPDKAYVFSNNYRSGVDGIGAGVLAHQGKVYFTNIPSLWQLEGGVHEATTKKALSTGYGVHTSFIGHDLHGLAVSPVDGKLYFSIGDRGANLTTKEGRKIEVPHCGAVFRCNPDGSELELFAKGLRNPQELAFDDAGNLFTGDNNSDSGDRARFVYLPEGADCGWHIGWQYMEQPYSRGCWNAEYMWHPPRPDQPAFIVPPITNIADGPSGLVYYPGTGLSDRYQNHFFMADFRGSPTSSGIRSFAVKPKGAGFELVDSHQFAWGVLATDVDFGPDGAMYLLDWVEGWGKTGKGRIHRVFDPRHDGSAIAKEVKSLLASDWSKKNVDVLIQLLGHADRRVRMEAQATLVRHEDITTAVESCVKLLNSSDNLAARRHAIWTLAQIFQSKTSTIVKLVEQSFDRILEQGPPDLALQVLRLGMNRMLFNLTPERAGKLLQHEDATVRAQAAQVIGKHGLVEHHAAILKLIENAGNDPWLRHAAIQGLVGIYRADPKLAMEAARAATSEAVQLAQVVAARRIGNDQLLNYHLLNKNLTVRSEAIRAAYDEPGFPVSKASLHHLTINKALPDQVQLRLLANWLRHGDGTAAKDIALYSANSEMPEKLRVEAARMLGAWAAPSGRDWVIGLWRPISARDETHARRALVRTFPELQKGSPRVLAEAIRSVEKLKLTEFAGDVLKLAEQTTQPTSVRLAALQAAASFKAAGLDTLTVQLLRDKNAELRKAAQGTLVKLDPAKATSILSDVLLNGEARERQAAIGLLAGMKSAAADAALSTWVNRLAAGEVPGELQLELVEAINQRNKSDWKPKLNEGLSQLKKQGPYPEYRPALVGGDAQAGRKVFFEKTAAACLRCHKVGSDGGEVGPELTHISKDKNREYLLEAMVDPNKTIAKGFELSIILMADGKIHQGVVKKENADSVTIITPEAKTMVLKKADIEERKTGKSAMPEDTIKHLTLRELRDVIEYLSTLK